MTIGVLASIVAASALGSLHCVAMCGPLVGMHGGSLRLAWLHSLGRLATYVVLGALAGVVGGAIDLAGRVGNVQRAATILAGLVVVAWGLTLLARALGHGARPRPSRATVFSSALVRIRTRRPRVRAWLVGVVNGLLPCGWLWVFVVTAGGTASPWRGAAVMVAFWLGTVPAMVGLIALAGPAFSRIRARMPAITAIAVLALGLGTLAVRWRDAGTTQVTAPHCPHCHGSAS
jgi:sulfite exporter TauE/SafE